MRISSKLLVCSLSLMLHTIIALLPLIADAQFKADTLLNTSTTIRNSTSDEYYFGFAEGDHVGFIFNEVYGASLRSFGFYAYPSSTMFAQSDATSITEKDIVIPRTGIYYFSLAQSGFLAGRRHCALKVWRIPANDAATKFNTTVYWDTRIDTNWFEREERYLIRTDTVFTALTNQIITLDKAGKNNQSTVSFMIPKNTYAWSWWVTTAKEASAVFLQSENDLARQNKIVKERGLMAYLALGGATAFASTKGAQSISMNFISSKQLQQFVSGAASDSLGLFPCTTLFGVSQDTLPGLKNLALLNPGKKKVAVSVKISVVQIWDTWGTRKIKDFELKEVRFPYLKD